MAERPSDAGEALTRWTDEFARTRETRLQFTERLEALVRQLISSHGIDVILIESRTKTVGSFRDKLLRKQLKYQNPLEQVVDLSGIRIIVYYTEDVETVHALLRQEFSVNEAESRLGRDDGDSTFGYESLHCVLKLSPKRSRLGEWERFSGLHAEVQIRTALQHAWASVSHKLVYKNEDSVPTPLRRRLMRLAALFEIADEQFLFLRNQSSELQHEYADKVGSGNLNVPTDAISISTLLDNPLIGDALSAIALEAGFRPPVPREAFEPLYRSDRETLVDIVTRLGFTTLEILSEAIRDKRVPRMAQQLCVLSQRAGGSIERTPEDVIARCLVGLHVADDGWIHEVYAASVAYTIKKAAEAVEHGERQ